MDTVINQFDNINIRNRSAIIYTRCSTQKQNSFIQNSASLDIQKNKCEEFCTENKYNIKETISEICSARTMKNQKKLLELINENRNINLIIFDVSRFSRNLFDGTELIKKCYERKIIIHSIKENIVTNNKENIYKFINALILSQNESDTISYRVKESFNYKRKIGSYIGKSPYGYKLEKNDKNITKLIEDDYKIKLVKIIIKIKYGCLFSDVNAIFKEIKNTDLNIPNKNNIILYGHYENDAIADIMNINDLDYNGKKWTSQNIINICKANNNTYNQRRNELCNLLINKLYNKKEVDDLYKKINGYELSDFNYLGSCKENINNIVNFLNKNHVSFCSWNIYDVTNALNYSENNKSKKIKLD
jgi:hypothetical protein